MSKINLIYDFNLVQFCPLWLNILVLIGINMDLELLILYMP